LNSERNFFSENPAIFATAGSNGQVLLFDIRDASSDDEVTLATSIRPFHSVAFNPVEPRLFVTGID
jgi:DDB1- and CUL4-associated factor 5